MTTVKQVDSLVVNDDAVAARLWPRLGPKVQRAYLGDRDRWIGLRRRVESGQTLSQSTLVAEQKVFAGWARAFRAAAGGTKRRRTLVTRRPVPTARRAPLAAAAVTAAAPAALAAPQEKPMEATMTSAPPLVSVAKSTGGAGAGAAVAGGLALAGLIAFAARRKRA